MDFVKGMHRYSFNGLTAVGDVIVKTPEDCSRKVVDTSVNDFFAQFAAALRVGMTVEQAYSRFLLLKERNPIIELYYSYFSYKPVQGEWWYTNGVQLVWSRGKVREVTGGNVRLRSTLPDKDPTVFSEAAVGMTLPQLRSAILRSSQYDEYCRPIISFTPPISIADKSITHAYRELETPPMLSTGRVQVDIYYPNGEEYGMPDTVVVTLYALTRIFADKDRTKVCDEAKSCVKRYFQFAYKQMNTDQRIRNLGIRKYCKPSRLQFTRDCCVVCEFKVVRGGKR